MAGLSLGVALTFGASLGVAGLWWGMAAGLTCAAIVGVGLVLRTDWEAEACSAGARIGAGGDGAGTTTTKAKSGGDQVELRAAADDIQSTHSAWHELNPAAQAAVEADKFSCKT